MGSIYNWGWNAYIASGDLVYRGMKYLWDNPLYYA